ncbi:MAG: aldo/keto reductase [Salinimicrobium sp.]
MRQKNTYSRLIWDLELWEEEPKGVKIQLFHHCVERDITSFFIDTSEFLVSPKDSLGTALSESGLSRDEIQLIGGIKETGINSEEIISKTDELLLNLKSDYLDLLLLDSSSSPEVVLPAVERLRSQGKVMETGVFKNDKIEDLPKKLEIHATHSSWKYTPAAVKMLTLDRPSSEDVTEMLFLDTIAAEAPNDKLRKMAEKYQLSQQQFLLAWLLQHPAHFHPVLKGNRQEEIDLAVKAFHTKLIREDWEKFPKQL